MSVFLRGVELVLATSPLWGFLLFLAIARIGMALDEQRAVEAWEYSQRQDVVCRTRIDREFDKAHTALDLLESEVLRERS